MNFFISEIKAATIVRVEGARSLELLSDGFEFGCRTEASVRMTTLKPTKEKKKPEGNKIRTEATKNVDRLIERDESMVCLHRAVAGHDAGKDLVSQTNDQDQHVKHQQAMSGVAVVMISQG